MGIRYLLDASAVLASINGEQGAEAVRELAGEPCGVTSVNLVEVVTKQLEDNAPADDVRLALDILGIEVIPVDERHAYAAATLHAAQRRSGLSLADSICIATARELGATAVTADRQWRNVSSDILLIR